MIDKNLIIALCVRDCSSYLDEVVSNAESIGSLFKKYTIVFVESDSSDSTLEKIKSYDKAVVISHGDLIKQYPSRTDRIAYCRNSYLDFAEDMKDEYDYLLVLDGDSASTEQISKESVLSNFNRDDWDMVVSNQPEGYYDIWALRHKNLMPFDCWKEFNKYGTRDAFEYFITSRFLKIGLEEDWIPVESAFGGAGFIKISSIQGARHIGHTDDGIPVCEWVPFCESLNLGNGKIFINPKFINSTILSEHIEANLRVLG